MLNSSGEKQIVNKTLASAAFIGLLGVILGAFGAHGLENTLPQHALQRYQTGVDYQFYHVAALLIIGVLSGGRNKTSRMLKLAGIFFITGIFLFSGSLYLYALTGETYFGMITPIGGISFIMGWVCLLLYAVKNPD